MYLIIQNKKNMTISKHFNSNVDTRGEMLELQLFEKSFLFWYIFVW